MVGFTKKVVHDETHQTEATHKEVRQSMKNFLRVLLVNAVTLLCAHGVHSKTIKVRVRGVQREASEVAKSIAARVQGTERYTVSDGDAELLIDVNCFESKEVSSVSGYICSFVFVYYPEKLAGMERVLGPIGLVTGRDVSSVAEDVFDTFVASSTNEKLESAQKHLRMAVGFYCHYDARGGLIIVDKNVKLRDGGILADVAPTVLDLMGIVIPAEMTGKSLITNASAK